MAETSKTELLQPLLQLMADPKTEPRDFGEYLARYKELKKL